MIVQGENVATLARLTAEHRAERIARSESAANRFLADRTTGRSTDYFAYCDRLASLYRIRAAIRDMGSDPYNHCEVAK